MLDSGNKITHRQSSVCPGGDECVCLHCVTICDTPLVHSVAMVMNIHMCWVFQVT